MPEPAILVTSVSRSFGAARVLKDISLRVAPGSIVGLLGPSGAGKTTLVKLIAGADSVSSGTVEVLGAPMPSLELMGQIGYMAQSDALYAELSGRENMEFFGALYGLSGDALQDRIGACIGLVGLGAELDKVVGKYSGGMKRRLSLAISLLHSPKILILDEPTVGIDPVLRIAIWKELRTYSDAGAAILVTTHVMDEAERCDLVCMMRDGELIALDTPAALKEATGTETLEGAFLYYAASGEAA